MKKNIMRVLSLVLVAAMLFAFCSCSQEIRVRFVDKDGNDINISGLIGGSGSSDANANSDSGSADSGSADSGSADSGSADSGSADTPSDAATEAPASDAATQAQADNSSSGSNDTAKATEAATQASNGGSTSAAPTGKEAIFNFYKTAANKIAENGAAGYTKKEWQALSNLNLTGSSAVDNVITNLAGNYMTKEADAQDQVCAKGSEEAKSRFPGCSLTDMSKVASATCTVQSNGNYKIVITMVNEDTPKKTSNFLGKVTNSILYWEDIDTELKNISVVKSYTNIHVIYEGFKIEAEMTPAGNFVSLNHLAGVNIKIGEAKVLVATLKDKSGHLDNTCKYTNFKY